MEDIGEVKRVCKIRFGWEGDGILICCINGGQEWERRERC